MESLKMKDLFEFGICFEVRGGHISNRYGEITEAQADYIEDATNNHDRLVEENAALKADRENAISKMSKSWQHNASDHPDLLSRFVDMANRQFEENTELREGLKLMIEQFKSEHNCEYEYNIIKWNEQLLAKHK